MLTTEAPVYELRGVTILRDHADPDQFYYLPPAPRLVERDGAAFTLYKYRRDLTDNPSLDPTRAKGAGLALFDVEAALPTSEASALRDAISSATGRRDARLDPAPVRRAEAHAIVGHGESGRLVDDLRESRAAPPTSPHHATFALALSAEGASLIERSASEDLLPVGVAYELRYLALTPSLHGRARLRYDRAYERLAASLGIHYAWLGAELDAELDKLISAGDVEIEVTAFLDEDDQRRQEAELRELVTRRIRRDFFAPTLPPSPSVGDEPKASSAMFVLNARQRVERTLKTFTVEFDGRVAVERDHVTAAFLSSLRGEGSSMRVRELDLDDPFFSSLSVSVSVALDFEEMPDLREVAVTLTHRDTATPLTFRRDDPGEKRFERAITSPADDEYTYLVEYVFDPDAGHGPTRITEGPTRTRRRVLSIKPSDAMVYQRLELLDGIEDRTAMPRVTARVRALSADSDDELASEVFTIAPEAAPVFRLRTPGAHAEPARLRARVEWDDAVGAHHVGEESDAEGDTFAVLGPFEAALVVLVVPAVDFAAITALTIEIRYADGRYSVERRLTLTTPDSARARIPLLDARRREFEWRSHITRADGTASETAWQRAEGSALVVRDTERGRRDVRITLVGEAGDLLGVRVDLWARDAAGDEQQASAFVEPGRSVTVSLPLDRDGALRYRYETRRFRADGDEPGRSGESDRPLLALTTSG